jgi:AcrR family transcriptional regulator
MPRAGLSTVAVVDAAMAIIDRHGIDGLTLAAVAERTGVATPSLYKHVGGLAELRTLVGLRVLEEMTTQLTAQALGHSGDKAVAALMRAYRAYAVAHPRRYAAMPADPLHDPVLREAGTRLIEVILAVLRGYGLRDAAAIHAIRCMRAVAHGFASLEAAGGFGLPEDLDDSYDRLISMYSASLPKEK